LSISANTFVSAPRCRFEKFDSHTTIKNKRKTVSQKNKENIRQHSFTFECAPYAKPTLPDALDISTKKKNNFKQKNLYLHNKAKYTQRQAIKSIILPSIAIQCSK
jgi:hypothetical protein